MLICCYLITVRFFSVEILVGLDGLYFFMGLFIALLGLYFGRSIVHEILQNLLNTQEELRKTNEQLRVTQLQLIESAKLESVGRMAAGVAHEVKNPLMTLVMGVNIISGSFPDLSEDMRAMLGDMNDAVDRADKIIKGLLDFAAPVDLEIAPRDLNPEIEHALRLVKHELTKYKISVNTELGDNLPRVRIDPNKMHQVLINLFVNAVHAMEGGGAMTVRSSVKQIETAKELEGRKSGDPIQIGDTVVLVEVEDEGVGIPEEKLSKVFDPFFTTKPPGKGTGMGLTIIRNIVEMHEGIVDVRNRPEGGVRAHILLKVQP